MKKFLDLLSNSKCKNLNKITFCLLVLFAFVACGGGSQVFVIPKPVYELKDSSGIEAFFLVKEAGKNKESLQKVLDSVANRVVVTDRRNYGRYIMYFYHESRGVNERIIQAQDEKSRYDFFEDQDNDFIAVYEYINSEFRTMRWSKKYK
jgi:hypothetical protein